MSVYTALSDEQFGFFCQQFGLHFKRALPIAQGIKNSNWFIQTHDDEGDDCRYVFTLFEERTPEDIVKMATIMLALERHLPVAAPLKKVGRQDESVGEACVLHYQDKAILIMPKLSGSHPHDIRSSMCFEMGKALATLHQTLRILQPAEQYGVPLYDWTGVKMREIQHMSAHDAQLMEQIWTAYHQLPTDLPRGLCHLDLFADNTLWNFSGEVAQLTGLLDFTEVSVEYYLLDMAISLNDFCTDWTAGVHEIIPQFDDQKMHAFIQGYETVRPLTDNEHAALPVMLAYSATLFWLLRLNVLYCNREQGRAGENILIKNPDLMRQLAQLHFSTRMQAHH